MRWIVKVDSCADSFSRKESFHATWFIGLSPLRIGTLGSWFCRWLCLVEQTYTYANCHNNTYGHTFPNANEDANCHFNSYWDEHTDAQPDTNPYSHSHKHAYAKHNADAFHHTHAKQNPHIHANPGG